jgi:hypothetical protein
MAEIEPQSIINPKQNETCLKRKRDPVKPGLVFVCIKAGTSKAGRLSGELLLAEVVGTGDRGLGGSEAGDRHAER